MSDAAAASPSTTAGSGSPAPPSSAAADGARTTDSSTNGSSTPVSVRSICWLRRALRLNDNRTLAAAASDAEVVFPVYIIDPVHHNPARMSANRARFLLDALNDLNGNLRRQYGARLFVLRGNPVDLLTNFVLEHGINAIYTDKDVEPSALACEKNMRATCKTLGVHFECLYNSTLYDINVLQKQEPSAPLDIKSFIKLLQNVGPPPSPTRPPATLNVLADIPDDMFRVPTLEELGWDTSELLPIIFKGGETEALRRLEATAGSVDYVKAFEKGQTNPTALNPDTSLLSCYLSYGCLSSKTYYKTLHETHVKLERPWSSDVSLMSQLYWREFFYMVSYSFPNMDFVKGNPLSRQIDWDVNNTFLQSWKNGQTGYPWIDACMNQLRTWGWLHSLSRHAVACFLTRGDLWLSWEDGRTVFEYFLLDHDWSLNNTNWLWQSGTGFDSARSMVYHPVDFPKSFDPKGTYVRYFVPQLKNMPDEYIYCPWKAPLSVQRDAKCIIGDDYPVPIVEHEQMVKVNIARMKLHYEREKKNTYLKFGPSHESDFSSNRQPSTAELWRARMSAPLPSITMLLNSSTPQTRSQFTLPVPTTRGPMLPPGPRPDVTQCATLLPAAADIWLEKGRADAAAQKKRAREDDA